jgi:hypothetical protein
MVIILSILELEVRKLALALMGWSYYNVRYDDGEWSLRSVPTMVLYHHASLRWKATWSLWQIPANAMQV